jgi:hypothetical protein
VALGEGVGDGGRAVSVGAVVAVGGARVFVGGVVAVGNSFVAVGGIAVRLDSTDVDVAAISAAPQPVTNMAMSNNVTN